MFTGPVGPVEVFFYWPETVFGNFYWPGAIGSPLASSPDKYWLPLPDIYLSCRTLPIEIPEQTIFQLKCCYCIKFYCIFLVAAVLQNATAIITKTSLDVNAVRLLWRPPLKGGLLCKETSLRFDSCYLPHLLIKATYHPGPLSTHPSNGLNPYAAGN